MTVYQESFGDDEYDVPADWHYGSPGEELAVYRGKYGMRYNWTTHLWECRCDDFLQYGRCRHVYRFRRQEDVIVNEDYL